MTLSHCTLCFIKSVYGVNCYKVHVGKMLLNVTVNVSCKVCFTQHDLCTVKVDSVGSRIMKLADCSSQFAEVMEKGF